VRQLAVILLQRLIILGLIVWMFGLFMLARQWGGF